MTVKDIFSAMKKEAYEKWVPCPIYSAEKPDKIQERHRMILIEWLIEVATEERYRRFESNPLIIFLFIYLFVKNNYLERRFICAYQS